MKFRIFVEDRSPGLYSGLRDVQAKDAAEAVRIAKKIQPPFRQRWGIENYHALLWPARDAASKRWLADHVNTERRVA